MISACFNVIFSWGHTTYEDGGLQAGDSNGSMAHEKHVNIQKWIYWCLPASMQYKKGTEI